jgi:transcriptional regulator with XRE-family HTH domain
MPTPRERLADLLKQARMQAGYESHTALARKLNVTRPVISKAENPAQPVPSDALLAAWSGVTGVPLDELTDLAVRCRSGTPEWFMPYVTAEAHANVLRCWSPLLVPGIVQTESYARAVMSVEGYSPERLAELVRARMDRQAVIGRTYITVVIDEHVLHRRIGTPVIMAEQCSRLATLAERGDITLHVVPEGGNLGLWGTISLATRDSMTTVLLETLEDVTSTSSDLISKSMLAFERILGGAMPRDDSLDLMHTMEDQWKSRSLTGE